MLDNIEYRHTLRALDRALRKSVERWLLFSIAAQLAVFLVGLLAIFLSILSQVAPFLLATFTIVSEACRLRSNSIRGTWESLHRELDAHDSLDWSISRVEISDLLTASSRKQRNQLAVRA